MASDNCVKPGRSRIEVECGDIMNYVEDRGTDLKDFRLGNDRCPTSFVIVAANRGCRSDRGELLQDLSATDVSRVNDVVAARKGPYCFRPKQAMSVGDQPHGEFPVRHEQPPNRRD